MLRKQLITLAIRSLPITKSQKRVIFCVTNKNTSHSNLKQLSQPQTITTDNEEIVITTTKHETRKIPQKFYRYLTNVSPAFQAKVLDNYFTLNIINTDPYLISQEVGNDFVALIKDDLFENMSHVIELNPGFGILTENLLQAGVPFINLYERFNEFRSVLNNLSKTYPDRLNIKIANILAMMKIDANQEKPGTKVLDNVPRRKWEDESCMQIIGATSKTSFIRHVIISTVFQSGFTMYGRPTFYLAIAPSVWNTFMYTGKRTSASCIMFNTLLDYKIFGSIDRNGFIPSFRSKRKTVNNRKLKADSEMFYVVKLEPKADLFKLFDGQDSILCFWHFVRHYFYKPSSKIIPELEKIIPDCGVRLIEHNYNIFTEFGDLNPSQAYDLFMKFKSWPEFDQSSFLLSLNEIKNTYDPYTNEHE